MLFFRCRLTIYQRPPLEYHITGPEGLKAIFRLPALVSECPVSCINKRETKTFFLACLLLAFARPYLILGLVCFQGQQRQKWQTGLADTK